MHDNSESFLVKNYRYIYLCIFTVSLLLIGASEFLFGHEPEKLAALFKLFFHELGFAGIVAVILVYTVETFSRERHRMAAERALDEINQDLFRAVYKRYIPEPVFEEVEKCVMLASIYRRCHELDYTIDDFDQGDGDCFKCVAETRYKLFNQLDQEAKHEITLMLERPLKSKYEPFCRVDAVEVNGRLLGADEITAHTTLTEQHVIFKYPILVPPKGGGLSVSTKSTLIKQKTDSEIWSSRLPSDGLNLTVSTPSKNVLVKASANHSETLTQKLDNPATRKWSLEYGIFPYQSIIFFWRPLDEKTD